MYDVGQKDINLVDVETPTVPHKTENSEQKQ